MPPLNQLNLQGRADSIPIHHGPLWSAREKDKLEVLLNAGALTSGLICFIVPIVALCANPTEVLVEPIMMLEKLYLFFFGCLILTLEVGHGGSQNLLEFQNAIYRNFRLLERISGKGLFHVFLSTNIWNLINSDYQSIQLQILFFIFSGVILTVGILHLIIGVQKMILLEKIRSKLQGMRSTEGELILPNFNNINPGETYLLERLNNRSNLDKYLLSFATSPAGSSNEILLDEEFNLLAQSVLNNSKFNFSPWELELIINAISCGGEKGEDSLDVVTKELGLPMTPMLFFDAVYEWLCPGFPMLL